MREFVSIVLITILIMMLPGLIYMLADWLAIWITGPLLFIGMMVGFISIIYFMMKGEEIYVD